MVQIFHHEGLITITNFTELNLFILTRYNRSRIEMMHRAKKNHLDIIIMKA